MSRTSAACAAMLEPLELPALPSIIELSIEEIQPGELSDSLRRKFKGMLIQPIDGAPFLAMPAGQDPQEREATIRELVRRALPGGAK